VLLKELKDLLLALHNVQAAGLKRLDLLALLIPHSNGVLCVGVEKGPHLVEVFRGQGLQKIETPVARSAHQSVDTPQTCSLLLHRQRHLPLSRRQILQPQRR